MADKFDIGVSKDDIKYLLELLYKNEKLSELEYRLSLTKLGAYVIRSRGAREGGI